MLPWQVELNELNKQIQSCSRPNVLLLKTNWEPMVSWVTQKEAHSPCHKPVHVHVSYVNQGQTGKQSAVQLMRNYAKLDGLCTCFQFSSLSSLHL